MTFVLQKNPNFWEPSIRRAPANPRSLRRIEKDLCAMISDPPLGIHTLVDEEDMRVVHLLIQGCRGTPYQGGSFHFLVDMTNEFPLKPPKVKCLTAGESLTRFNPNVHKNGRVCLSILGTFVGPSWTPAITLTSLGLSLQSLFNERPYHNEPGYELERNPGDAERYSTIVRHETIRVAVCDAYDRCLSLPMAFRERVVRSVGENRDELVQVCRANAHLDGTEMIDPFGEKRGLFQFSRLVERLLGFDLDH